MKELIAAVLVQQTQLEYDLDFFSILHPDLFNHTFEIQDAFTVGTQKKGIWNYNLKAVFLPESH